jgi:predicted transcriptional regulator of viral defense system
MPTPVFFRYQVERLFPNESRTLTNSQLSRWVEKKKLVRLRRELFLFPEVKIDEMVLANFIYRPSYISLESALNYYGIIPDVVQNVTSVSPVTTRTFRTGRGVFIYSKIMKNLYFGWQTVKDSKSDFEFSIAEPEKALLDYVYIRRIRDLTDQRIDFGVIDPKKLIKYSRIFPSWVINTINEQYHK